MTESGELLTVTGLDKSFLDVQVLHGVDLTVRAGTVHALVGENGAGKSTLMKILAGVHRADRGRIVLDGREVDFTHPLQAQQAGVSTVFQEFNLLPERTVAQNVFLGREPRTLGVANGLLMSYETARLLRRWGVEGLSPDVKVRALSVAQQQVVEIVKALSHDARVISMDEPTAALADREVELLYQLIRRLRERGVAVLYVSHRLAEIFEICDRVTVLKDGRLVDTADVADTAPDDLVRKMVGRPVSAVYPAAPEGSSLGEVRLKVAGGGNEQLDGVDLEVRAGEILGVAGLAGSGRTELAHAVFGVAPFTRGTVSVDGKPVTPRSPRAGVRAGLALVTEDRKAQGLALNQSISANFRMVLDALGRRAPRGRPRMAELFASLQLVSRGDDQEVRFLSGGNQQKVVLAKWLACDPAAIVLDEPTRGVDVGAKQAVYAMMRELAGSGVAIVLISSELPEVIGMSDRVLVMRDGRIGGELGAGDLAADTAEATVMALATGYAAREAA